MTCLTFECESPTYQSVEDMYWVMPSSCIGRCLAFALLSKVIT